MTTTELGAWMSTGSATGSGVSSTGSGSAYPVPMTELPADVLMRLGPSPQDLTRLGSSRVLRGNGLVAKTGSPEGIAREAFLFGEAAALLPVGTPTLVASRTGLAPDGGRRSASPLSPEDVTPLAQLALVHELFVGATGIEHERFRDVFGREREALLELARGSANAAALPEPLSGLLDDPAPLDEIVDYRAANARARRRVVGQRPDAREGLRVARLGRVRRGTRRVRPLDVALRLGMGAGVDQPRRSAGRVPGSADDEGGALRLQARGGRVPRSWASCSTQLARLTDREPDQIERVIERRNLIAIGLFD